MTAKSGRFLTFEGGEGAGKSTQIKLLSKRLSEHSVDHVLTREPGGTEGAEVIRELLVSGKANRWTPQTEICLHYAARADHLARIINPTLEMAKWVLCDRFMDSTRAYQGSGQGGATALIDQLEAAIVADSRPDLTLIMDLPAEEGLNRAQARSARDRYESYDLAFHERLRDSFLAIARSEPDRCVVIDASQPVDNLSDQIWTLVSDRYLA